MAYNHLGVALLAGFSLFAPGASANEIVYDTGWNNPIVPYFDSDLGQLTSVTVTVNSHYSGAITYYNFRGLPNEQYDYGFTVSGFLLDGPFGGLSGSFGTTPFDFGPTPNSVDDYNPDAGSPVTTDTWFLDGTTTFVFDVEGPGRWYGPNDYHGDVTAWYGTGNFKVQVDGGQIYVWESHDPDLIGPNTSYYQQVDLNIKYDYVSPLPEPGLIGVTASLLLGLLIWKTTKVRSHRFSW